MAQPVERSGHRAETAPVPERVPQQPLDVHARVRRPVARRGHARERVGLDRPDETGARRRNGPAEVRRFRRARRRQCGRPDRDSGPLPPPVGPGGEVRFTVGIHGATAPRLRPVRLCRGLSPRRAVVPEAGRLRAGGASRPPGWRLELPPVPRQLRVLRRLRQLRRANHGAGTLRRRRDGQASRQDAATGWQRHLALRAGGRSRLRVDGRSELRRGERPILGRARRDRGRVRRSREAGRPPARRDATHRRRHPPAHATRAHAAGAALHGKSRGRPSSTSVFGTGAIPTPRSPWSTRRTAGWGPAAWSTRRSSRVARTCS